MRWVESMIAKITKLQDIANRHGNGRIAKEYNANLGYGIIETKMASFSYSIHMDMLEKSRL